MSRLVYPDGMVHEETYYPPKHLLRDKEFKSVGQTSVQLLGPNEKRWAVIIGAPNANFMDQLNASSVGSAIDTSTTGNKISATVSAGGQATLDSATFFQKSGAAGVVATLTLTRGNVLFLQQFTNSGVFAAATPLLGGDVINWNVTTAINPSTSDFTINLVTTQGVGRLTIDFGRAAVLDQGINQYPGQTPLILMYESLGDALREEINAVCANGTATIAVIDVFRP